MTAQQHLTDLAPALEQREVYQELLDNATKSLYVGRYRAPYDDQARMEDVMRKNAAPVPGRHAAEVPA